MTTPEQEAPQDSVPATPPGWYPVNAQTIGWYDGRNWTGHYHPIATPQTVEQAGAFQASFSWWGSFVAGFIPALVIYLINDPRKPNTNRFARFSAGEALNVQLTLLCALIPLYVVYLVTFFVIIAQSHSSHSSIAPMLAVVWLLMFSISFTMYAVYILGAVRTYKAVWWRAKYAIPFLRAHRLLAPTAPGVTQ